MSRPDARQLRAAVVALALLGCKRDLPPALALPDDAPQDAATDVDLSTLETALRSVLNGDPLGRRARLPDEAALRALPSGAPLADFAAGVRRAEAPGRDLVESARLLGNAHPGTLATGLSRGYRLGIADRLLADNPGAPDQRPLLDLAPLLTDLDPARQADGLGRQPLSFLADERPFAVAVRRTGDRWVLAGWLDGPDVPLVPVAEALRSSSYDALRETQIVRILLGRAEGRAGSIAAPLADLRQATTLSLQRASADRHREQGAWADVRRAAAADLGVESQPVATLLTRAADGFAEGAADPVAAGGGLLATAALRLDGRCDWDPCQGLDRVDTVARAARWADDLVPLARAWRVIALKDATDAMEVGHDTVLFPQALVDVVDALLGTGVRGLDAALMTARSPTPEVWGGLGSALGEAGATSWAEVRVALGAHLASEAELALEVARDEDRPWLTRIQGRAVP